MFSRITIALMLAAITIQSASAQSRTHRRRGALLGGLAGAAIGVAIGDKGNNETAGALIGGAVGAVAGGVIGDAKDQRIHHNRIYHPDHARNHAYHPNTFNPSVHPSTAAPNVVWHPHAPVVGVPVVDPLSQRDVLNMVHGGLSESLILKQIHHRGLVRPLSVPDLISLHQQGVSETVLDAMQQVTQPTTVVPVR